MSYGFANLSKFVYNDTEILFSSEFISKWDKHYQKTYYLGEEFNYQSFSDETFIKEVSFRDNDVFRWW